MSKDPKRVLIDEALKIISDPEKWCKHLGYSDKYGRHCLYENAVRFCALGAMEKSLIDNKLPMSLFCDILNDFQRKYKTNISYENDIYGREHVIEKLKELYNV